MEVDNTYIEKFGNLAKDIISMSNTNEYVDLIGFEELFKILDKYFPYGVPDVNLKENNGWISVEHKLPEEPEKDMDTYLEENEFYDMNDACFCGEFKEYNTMIVRATEPTTLYYIGNKEWYDTETKQKYGVSHWQPMPEPPVQERNLL